MRWRRDFGIVPPFAAIFMTSSTRLTVGFGTPATGVKVIPLRGLTRGARPGGSAFGATGGGVTMASDGRRTLLRLVVGLLGGRGVARVVLFGLAEGLLGLTERRRPRRVSMPLMSSWLGVLSHRARSARARFDVSDAETVILACLARSCDRLRLDRREKRRA